ncbi:hypothetical protein [Psychromonas sp. SP041]|uniref:hypothetical protein n=1 Tax=Psychromonas sp. SP041 TaxID=1365007 RepID=UPI00046F8F57|nr:hypothetical protein [Psychromonas sp. SP041]
MSSLSQCLFSVNNVADYELLLATLKDNEKNLKASSLSGIHYAQFIGFNLRLERLVSILKVKNSETSDSFNEWQKSWIKTFSPLV